MANIELARRVLEFENSRVFETIFFFFFLRFVVKIRNALCADTLFTRCAITTRALLQKIREYYHFVRREYTIFVGRSNSSKRSFSVFIHARTVVTSS